MLVFLIDLHGLRFKDVTTVTPSGLFVSAPVGHAATHSPQLTQLEAPIGSSRSKLIRVVYPLPVRPITSPKSRLSPRPSPQAEV